MLKLTFTMVDGLGWIATIHNGETEVFRAREQTLREALDRVTAYSKTHYPKDGIE